ncbi:hypothetical protein CBW65_11295 [Tumebacillus avium]|uniref:HTH cro/C1-type domain-containing protein n=1 Tax=Tumebacillus avium TaxID=1903704 RepID=A0A1Y0INA9_9BACL|nr:tetratricopeptide repeat protein [Tumebacillus avium]ARU61529.1 hypothetical protein CBW65_11295 [Tumebacillus avium]
MNNVMTETIGEKIRRLRLERGMSQGDLADGFVTVSMISQLERGKNTASIELLHHIARKLQVHLHELVRNELDQMELYNRHKLAKIYLDLQQPDLAEPMLDFLREQAELSHADQLDISIDFSECYNQQGRYDLTLELLSPIVAELENHLFDDVHVMAKIRKQLGNARFMMNDFTQAYYNYQKAYDLVERFTEHDEQAAYISFNLGHTLRKLGQHQLAIFYLERAQRYFQNRQDVRRVADTLFANGQIYFEASDQKRAAELFEQAHVLYTGLNMISWAVKVQHNVAALLALKEDKDAAIVELKKCAEFYLRERDHKNYLLVLSKLAELYVGFLPEEAENHLKLAKEIVVQHSLEETEECAAYLRVCSKHFLNCQRNIESVRTSLNSAELYAKMGIIAEQVESLEVAVDAYRGLGELDAALDLERKRVVLLGKMYRREGVK